MSEVIYHPNFDEYVEMIVAHPNYSGLYYDRKKDGRVRWVATKKTKQGAMRQEWWDEKCKELNVAIPSDAARIIHPTGKHVCQCCGEERSIFYEYPTKNTAKTLNKILGTTIDPNNDEERAECTIKEIILGWCNSRQKLVALAKAFKLPVPNNKEEFVETVYRELVNNNSSRFSPGVMCNPPDRYNGFHSYALCCRTKFDKGRQNKNMQTYGQDRRAYEEWADGDWNYANRLMGEFRKQAPMVCPKCNRIAKMSADHVGPISLGFCHSQNFAPMCKSCNSTKNNRLTKSDVDELIRIEDKGIQVISWHAQYIWDIVKNRISNDDDAKQASSIMTKCHQNVLNILAILYKKTGKDFLMRYLHPEYSFMDYRFKNFDLKHLDQMQVVANPLDSENKRKNKERYVRIAFESLDNFLDKDNRKNYFLIEETSQELNPIVFAIRNRNFDLADKKLKALIKDVSMRIYQLESGVKLYDNHIKEYRQKAAEDTES